MFEEAIRNYLKQHKYNAIRLKGALIDMDGVLFDSMPYHVETWLTVLHARGINYTPKDVYLNEGRTGKGSIELIFQESLHRAPSDEEIKTLYSEKAKLFDAKPEAPVMPGAAEVLELLHQDGLTEILVTGSGQKMLLKRIDKNFPGYFSDEHMVTAFDVRYGKPHPEPYLKGLEKGCFKANEVFVIDNAPLGVEAAKAAGIFTIAVNTGPLEDFYLHQAGADIILPSMEALAKAWPSLKKAFEQTQV